LRAEMFATEKRFKEAQAILTVGVARQPGSLELRTALASLCQRQGEPDKALALLDLAAKDMGDKPELQPARARIWASRPAAAPGPALRKLEEAVKTQPAEVQTRLLAGLAEANLRAGLPADASRLWEQLARMPQHARDLRLRLLMFDTALQRGDDAAMQRILAEVKTIEEGESAWYLFGQASRRLARARQGERSGIAEARALAERVVTIRADWA